MRRLLAVLAIALTAVFAFSAIAPAATSTDQRQNERISKLEASSATKTELAAVKKELNERISQLVTRVNTVEAHDNGQDPRIAALEVKVAELGKGSGGEEPPAEEPKEEPPVEEPPAEEPPVEPPHEEPPTQTLHCFSNPAACGFPAPSNTGTTGTLTASGSITASTAGQTISSKDVTGTINVTANNVTIDNVRVTQNTSCGGTNTCGNYAIRIAGGVSGTVIKHVETRTEGGKTCEHDIRNTGGSLTIEGAYLHACDSNVYAVGPTVLKDSYGIGKLDISTDHVENVYFSDSSFTAVHDTLLNPIGQTAVIFGNVNGGSGGSCSNHLTVERSLLAGGGFTLYPCGNGTSKGSSSASVTGNHFARCTTSEVQGGGGTWLCKGGSDANGYYPKSGDYGLESYGFGTVWSGNVWDDNGAAIAGP